jgi:rRNA maturation protein Nop10
MKDIKLLEVCNQCGEHLTLMESISYPEGMLWAVKRCLNCGGYPVEEVVKISEDIVEKNAKVLSNIAQITVEEATEMLQKVMNEYKIKDENIGDVIDKLNNLEK